MSRTACVSNSLWLCGKFFVLRSALLELAFPDIYGFAVCFLRRMGMGCGLDVGVEMVALDADLEPGFTDRLIAHLVSFFR